MICICMDTFSELTPDKMNGDHRLCPVLKNPEPDCYCMNLSSQAISLAVRFCILNYTKCDIYLHLMDKGLGGTIPKEIND